MQIEIMWFANKKKKDFDDYISLFEFKSHSLFIVDNLNWKLVHHYSTYLNYKTYRSCTTLIKINTSRNRHN